MRPHFRFQIFWEIKYYSVLTVKMESFVSKLRSRKGRNLKEKPKKRLDKNESMEDQGQGPYVHDKEGNENKVSYLY